ncbi:MAG: thioredoxin domain-containing protein [Candidatus Eisenbacteria bacterium]|nr:thioredoxin domain-containing protein [Candidatus Eisenbacteria bacterium]
MTQDHFLTRCPSCGAANKIPVARVGQQARCGRCKTALPKEDLGASAPIAVTDGQFDAVTRHSSLPVLVDFWAAWCSPCRSLAPELERLAADLAGRLIILKMDTEAEPFTPSRFGVQAIPTMVLLRRGIEVERLTGAMPAEAIRSRVERFL